MAARRILLIGATGLVGSRVAGDLLEKGFRVDALVRRSTGRHSPGWHEHVADPAEWPSIASRLDGEVAISALGTTLRKAGSRRAFRAVDRDAVVDFAGAARAAGCRRMILVSSVGADAGARNFYLRVKGETEAALRALDFDRLDLIRPGLLRGERDEHRPGERLGLMISPVAGLLLRGSLARFAAIDASDVAAAIVALADAEAVGTFIHHNPDLYRLVRA